MFGLSAPTVSGKSVAGLKLDHPIDEIVKYQQPVEIHPLGGSVKYRFNQVTLCVRNGKVIQLGMKLDYQGKLRSLIGIGATIRDVQLVVGKVIEDEENNLVVPGMPGWCFEQNFGKMSTRLATT